MQAASRAVEHATGKGEQAHHQRVQPDQRIEDEIGTQGAQPAVLQSGNCIGTLPRRRCAARRGIGGEIGALDVAGFYLAVFYLAVFYLIYR